MDSFDEPVGAPDDGRRRDREFVNGDRAPPLREYLEMLPDVPRSVDIRQLFRDLWAKFDLMGFGGSGDLVMRVMRHEPSLDARCLGSRIYVTKGLIDHILDAKTPPLWTVIPEGAPLGSNFALTAEGAMLWVLAHEFAHLRRRHSDVDRYLQERADARECMRVFEHDSDLCAMAAVYRWLQHSLGPDVPDDITRQLSLYCVFWAMRSLPNNSDTNSIHPPLEQRIAHVSSKLSMLNLTEGEPPDVDLTHPDTMRRIDMLEDCLARFEIAYLSVKKLPSASSILPAVFTHYRSGEYAKVYKKWNEIRAIVSEISGTRTAIHHEGWQGPGLWQ